MWRKSELVPDVDDAVAILLDELEPGDVVLVKASRSAGLEQVALRLIEAVGASAGRLAGDRKDGPA